MPNIAFWNMCGSRDPSSLGPLAREFDVDVLVTAENGCSRADVLRTLNAQAEKLYREDVLNPKLRIYRRYSNFFDVIHDSAFGYAIRQYRPPIGSPFTLVAVRLGSKLFESPGDQAESVGPVIEEILRAETLVAHSRTLVVGDFNMDPFEDGMVGATRFHAVADRRIAATRVRQVKGTEYAFFFNPMWSHFGDSEGAPGTYFRNSGTFRNQYWHIFDQVLLRPDFIPAFEGKGVRIVTAVGGKSLLSKRGRPQKRAFSDHLPIVVELSEIMEQTDV